jgi:hypothetical protein
MGQNQHTRKTLEALAFLRSHQERLIEVYMAAVRQCKGNFFTRLDEEALHKFASENITGIINRFNSVAIRLDHTQRQLSPFFMQGVTLQDFNQVFDTVMQNLKVELRALLADEPELLDYMIQKLTYMRQAYGSTVSIAMLRFQQIASDFRLDNMQN